MGRHGLSDQGRVILEASQGHSSYKMGHTWPGVEAQGTYRDKMSSERGYQGPSEGSTGD